MARSVLRCIPALYSPNIREPYSATSTLGIEPVMRRWLALEQLHYALPETFVLPSHVALVGRLPGTKLFG